MCRKLVWLVILNFVWWPVSCKSDVDIKCAEHVGCKYVGESFGEHFFELENGTLTVNLKPDHLELTCTPADRMWLDLAPTWPPAFSTELNVSAVSFRGCGAMKWATVLRRLRVSVPRRLVLRSGGLTAYGASHFAGLVNVEELRLNSVRLQPAALTELRNLRHLIVENAPLPLEALPATLKSLVADVEEDPAPDWGMRHTALEFLVLRGASSLKGLAGANALHTVRASGAPLLELWPTPLPSLQIVTLSQLQSAPVGLWPSFKCKLLKLELLNGSLRQLPRGWLKSCPVQNLTLRGLELQELPSDLLLPNELLQLDLSNNNLEKLPDWLSLTTSLETLDVSHNLLQSLRTPSRCALRSLVAGYNPLKWDDVSFGVERALAGCGKLELMRLEATGLVRVPAVLRLQATRLADLRLQKNNITELTTEDLTWRRVVDTEVELGDNPLTTIYAPPPNEDAAGTKSNILLRVGSSLRCDCGLWSALTTDGPVKVTGTCDNGTDVTELTPAKLACDVPCEECNCFIYGPSPNTTHMYCEEAPTVAPHGAVLTVSHTRSLEQLRPLEPAEMWLRAAGLRALRAHELGPELQVLDIRNNSIQDLDAATVSRLCSLRELYISHNPLRCACALQPLLTCAKDIRSVRCDGRLLSAAPLCARPAALLSAAIASVLLAVFAVTAAVLAYRSRLSLKQLLQRLRGLPPTTEALYDIFISYCHSDVTLALNLVEKLESAGLKVCEHSRDWRAGDLLWSQAQESVRTSRRTLAILSEDSLKAHWPSVERRAALKHESLILLLLPNITVQTVETADPSLANHMLTTTYLKTDDVQLIHKIASLCKDDPKKLRENKATKKSKTVV